MAVKKKCKIVSLTDARKKTNPYKLPQSTKPRLTAATHIVNAPPKLKGGKVYDKDEKVGPSRVADSSKKAANDAVRCQDINPKLRLWLEAYCGIPNNVCPIDETEENQKKRIKRMRSSINSRRRRNRPDYIKAKRITWDNRPTLNRHPVDGWPGYRSPTLVELLVQAYKKGYSFEKCTSIKATKAVQKPEVVFQDIESYYPSNSRTLYQEIDDRLYKALEYSEHLRIEDTKHRIPWYLGNNLNVVDVDTKPVDPSFQIQEKVRYLSTLLKFDCLNGHIDFEVSSNLEEVQFFGEAEIIWSRYEGRKAAEFAHPRRFFSRSDKVASDIRWHHYLRYYQKYRSGELKDYELEVASQVIFSRHCAGKSRNFIDRKINKILPTRIGEPSELLLLPHITAADVSKIAAEDDKKVTETLTQRALERWTEVSDDIIDESNRVAEEILSPHPTGHSQSEIFNISIRRAWKNFPGLLCVVPEDYSLEDDCIKVPLHPLMNDKLSHLKTG